MLADKHIRPMEFTRLRRYVELLDKWRRVTSLISPAAFEVIWNRHILDSIYLQRCFPSKLKWLDLGSGAGLPSVVISILLAEEPFAQVHCVESDGRKCSFLRAVANDLSLPVKVHNVRAETLSSNDFGEIDVVTARAFSSMQRIWELSEKFVQSGATLALPRGESSRSEIVSAEASRYHVAVHDNPAANGGFFLEVRRRG